MDNYLKQLEERKKRMIDYLLLKVQEEDWHGTADAAMDLRDIESERLGYLKSPGKFEKEAVKLLQGLPHLEIDPAYENIRNFLFRVENE